MIFRLPFLYLELKVDFSYFYGGSKSIVVVGAADVARLPRETKPAQSWSLEGPMPRWSENQSKYKQSDKSTGYDC